MATKDSMPSVQSRSTTTPTGKESVTPVSQPSSLGELSASMVTETDRRLEAIQRAHVCSLMGADKTKEPQEKTPKKQSPTLAARPKKYALEMWVEIETSAGVYCKVLLLAIRWRFVFVVFCFVWYYFCNCARGFYYSGYAVMSCDFWGML